jgi:hypothetical protein
MGKTLNICTTHMNLIGRRKTIPNICLIRKQKTQMPQKDALHKIKS